MKEEILRKSQPGGVQPVAKIGDIPVYCSHDEIVEISTLKPNPKNPNQHPENQIELLANIIEKQGWRQPIKVSTRSGYIVSGHGRYEAALFIGAEAVPVDFQDYADEESEMADLLADNRIAELAFSDNQALAEVFHDLGDDIEKSLTGYTDNEISDILNNAVSDGDFSDEDYDDDYEEAFEAPDEFPEYDEDIPVKYRCPKCGYEWS